MVEMKYVLGYLFILQINSCEVISQRQIYTYANNQFDLDRYNAFYNSTLETEAIYFHPYLRMGFIGDSLIEDTSYNTLQFLNNGQFKFINLDHEPTFDEVDSNMAAEFHYYKIENNILMMEIYADPMNGFDYWKGNIYQDSIVFYKINNAKMQLTYKKIK